MTFDSRVFALPFLLLFSGCTAEPSLPLPALPSAPPQQILFDAPVTVAPLRNDQSETFVETSPDGRVLLTCLHGEFREPSIMYASTDSGLTWRELKASPSPGAGGDCEVALGGDGTWFFLHSTVAGATIAATSDEGRTWLVNPLAAVPINGLADRPWLEAAGNDLILTYSGAGIAARVSSDKGASWSTPQIIVPPSGGQFQVPGHLVVGPDRATAYQPYMQVAARYINSHGQPVDGATLGYAESRDAGRSWRTVELGPPVPALRYHPAMAAAGDGTLYYAYWSVNGTNADAVVHTSRDGGATWTAPSVVIGGAKETGSLWFDGRPDGSADLLILADAAGVEPGATDVHVLVARLRPDAARLWASVQAFAKANGEFFSLDHAADGRIRMTLIEGRNLEFVAEAGPT